MDKHEERKPIDDFFARKLSDLSLPPSSDGFNRLQARLQQKQETPVVFWRSPTVYRYTAAAACLLLAVTAGWQYWSTTDSIDNGARVAITEPAAKPSRQTEPSTALEPAAEVVNKQPIGADAARSGKTQNRLAQSTSSGYQEGRQIAVVTPEKKEAVGQNNDVKKTQGANVLLNQPVATAERKEMESTVNPATEQLARNKAEPPAPAERVLIVTIAEPKALVAAQMETETKPAADNADAPADGQPSGKLWQQLKRIKSGEVFARGENRDDEPGLLNRAYSGLKRSIDKEKSARQ